MSNEPTPKPASSTPSKTPGEPPPQLPRKRHGKLEPETRKRLGRKNPEGAWVEIQAAYLNALANNVSAMEKEAERFGLDLETILPTLTRKYAAETILNEIAYENPDLDLAGDLNQDPLKTAKALLNALTI
jgi:hypothetical protein